MLSTQSEIRKVVPGFTFNLGFSGKYYRSGSIEENAGDDLIIGMLKGLIQGDV